MKIFFPPVCPRRWGGQCSQTAAHGSLWHDAGLGLWHWKQCGSDNNRLQAMFSDSFRESSARCVRFPGVTCATFTSLLHFLYTGRISYLSQICVFLHTRDWFKFRWRPINFDCSYIKIIIIMIVVVFLRHSPTTLPDGSHAGARACKQVKKTNVCFLTRTRYFLEIRHNHWSVTIIYYL